MGKPKRPNSKTLLYCAVVLLCTVIAVQAWAQDRGGAKPRVSQWQHLALTHVIGSPGSELANQINQAGREGWELVSVGNIMEAGNTSRTVFYFKKPL